MSEEEVNPDDFYEYWEGMVKPPTLELSKNHEQYISIKKRIAKEAEWFGFVNSVHSGYLELTPAGKALISAKRKEKIFLRQLLKFQIPSPYHKPTANAAHFCIKPYLELFRLIRQMGTVKFDEMRLFGMQLTDYHKFDEIIEKINKFRTAKANHKGSYKQFYGEYTEKELKEIYKDEIKSGNLKVRENNEASVEKFLKTKSSNMRDYTDACFRYLRATGMVNISQVGKSISIAPEKIDEVDFFLAKTDREPCFVDDETEYEEYLCDAKIPVLLTDDRSRLVAKIRKEFPSVVLDESFSTEKLKDLLDTNVQIRKDQIITAQIKDLKDYKLYDDIQNTFKQITDDSVYDASLMLEWNTWRAMTMLDGGIIKANLKFDDYGKPMSTAQGNMADIVCDYGDFGLTVEVTMASGQKQYEMEGEPVSRHLGKYKKSENKPAYCLFIAPTINDACIAHFYMLQKMNIAYYGGKSTIVPLPLNIFQKMLEDSYKATYTPNPEQVKTFFDYSKQIADTCKDEQDWYQKITQKALNWLN